CQQESHWSWTF
nr:immunoglobulin light chain junction region [Macaca mulatta]MOV75629.1 immunoglobulin light chain junction region [Macaca mulatta]